MGKALYRAHRPTSLDTAVGQEHITSTLKNALKKGDISHAYLLTGPRGTGKTSIARILAHEINNLPYIGDDAQHLDIIEIDAASNRRIDDIRDLRDKVHIAPTSAKYKVYIIDEVHMLTSESFNALLKTLEEPPAHVVFILATTEAHKLPETIISRTQRFTFRPVELEKVTAHLRTIADKEKISIDDAALQLIAEHGDGSFRDSINLLDQARGQAKTLTVQHVRELLGVPATEALQSLLHAVSAHDSQQLISDLSDLQQHGQDAVRIAKHLANLLRTQLVTGKLTISAPVITLLLTKLLDIPSSSNPFRLLEIVLLEACFTGEDIPVVSQQPKTKIVAATAHPAQSLAQPVTPKISRPQTEEIIVSVTPKPTTDGMKTVEVAQLQPKAEAVNVNEIVLEPTPENTYATGSVDPAIWQQVLNEVKKRYNTLYGIARMANVTPTENGLKLGFKFAFHQKRVNESKNKTIIVETIEQLTGVTIILDCVVEDPKIVASVGSFDDGPASMQPATDFTKDIVPVEEPALKQPVSALADISNIFGGGEVLES